MAPFFNRVYGGGAATSLPVDSLVPKSFAEFFVGFSAKDRKCMEMQQMYMRYMDNFSLGIEAFEKESERSLQRAKLEVEVHELGKASSSVPSVASSARSSGVRLAGIRRIASWRSGSSSVGSLPVPHSIVQESGYCYLSVVKPECRPVCGEKLGPWLPLRRMLAIPTSSVAIAALDVLNVVPQAGDTCHISQGGDGRLLGPVLSAVAASLPVVSGTLSEVVRKYTPDAGCSLTLDTRVGGETVASTLQEYLAVALGEPQSVFSATAVQSDLQLVSRSVGMLSGRDKDRFRLLELLGDSAITHSLVARVAAAGGSAQDAQEQRTAKTSNVTLSAAFVRNFNLRWFSYPAGVDPATGNVGAKFLEAVVGMVDTHFGNDKVEVLVTHLGLLV